MSENIITIDGQKLEFTPGETILEVARRNKIFIPSLCQINGAKPTGACRVCVVEIEGGRGLSPSCAMPAGKDMVVHANSPNVINARRTIISLLLQSGNHNCSISNKPSGEWTQFQQDAEDYDQSSELCPAHSACKLQAYAYKYQVDTSGLERMRKDAPLEMASPLIVRDFSRCIFCGRCVDACNEIQVNNAISHGFRGAKSKIVAMGDDSIDRSECVFCGECIQACPVAALMEKKGRYQIRPWEGRHVRTTCHYCGVGCQLDLHVKDDKIMKVTGAEDGLPNQGRLCIKGRFGYDFLQSPDRLTQPMIRENGKLRQATWDEALDLIADKIKEIKEKDGPEALAGISSAKSTNESLFLMQKLFRVAIGTNNLSSPFAANSFNRPLKELERASRILLIGSDITEENPVAGTFIKRATKIGAQLIVIDDRQTKIGTFAKICLQAREGTEVVLINGLIQELINHGRKTSNETKENAAKFTLEHVAETTGIKAEDIKFVADILDSDESTMLVYGSRVATGAEAFVQLQEVLDNLDKECGGVNYLGDLNNSQGACDMGLLPALLPGYTPVDDTQSRKRFEEAWGVSLTGKPGLNLAELVKNMSGNGDGQNKQVRFLYCAGENLTLSEPVFPEITKALKTVDFLVVQDMINHETLEYAQVVLPAAGWSEDEGTYTNCERRISRMRKAVPAPGEAKPETWIYTQLANRLGQNWTEAECREIWNNEIITLVPQLKELKYEQIEGGGQVWPLSAGGEGGYSLVKPTRSSFNYHHRTLLEHCEGLLESLPEKTGLGKREAPMDPEEVTRKFVEFLNEEEKTEVKEEIDEILATYRPRMGGLIPVLQKVQGIIGFLPVSVQNYIALGLGIPPSNVIGVVTFYHFFTMVPRGKHIVRVCLGTACFVKGSAKVIDNLELHLKVKVGETTRDREFSLDVVRCLGACGLAPVMVVDETTYGQLNPKEVVAIVEKYRGTTE